MNPYTEFEHFTQRIIQKLVNNDVLKPTRVQRDKKLKGKSGCVHQIDVYWEYEKDGKMHRVAIECKNYKAKVSIGKVRDFVGVLQDLDNVRGIMVCSKGYQKGAKKYADYYGVSLKILRRPDKEESIGTITTNAHMNLKKQLYLIDEEWANENNFNIDQYRQVHVNLYPNKADYWRSATHLPIETIDPFIRDSKENIISRFDNLGLMFLEKQEPGSILIFPFKDGWVKSRYWGLIKIREVLFEYENKSQEMVLNIAADGFVEAILEDALGGKTYYMSNSD